MIAVVDTLEINCGYSIQLDDDINITQKFSSSKQTPSFSFLSQKFLFFILKGSFLANQQALLSEINQAYFSETIPITFEPVPIAEDLKVRSITCSLKEYTTIYSKFFLLLLLKDINKICFFDISKEISSVSLECL
ncbi:hypothetical protein J3Q64DRAFT_1703022 [Phycomyces blakesleeanus]|uniref:Uncharacterized protein n=1 Tax=Phycomyces blakesleeanus TaxID=4837 RepID=A0ABR3AML6_PHYBL